MRTRTFHEIPEFRDANRHIEHNLGATPAVLSDERPGVAIFLGRFKLCLSRDGAYRLATHIVNALEKEPNE